MFRDLCFILLGYLLGSVLFARVWGKVVAGKDITQDAPDQNPGTTNAFRNGGVLCGLLTLVCDLLKGFVPVFLYLRAGSGPALGFVMAAPVLGHVFPVFAHFRGGKGIATTFGCLLALLPNGLPLTYMVLFFLFFSLVLRISPNYYRTIAAYVCTEAALLLFAHNTAIITGFSLICLGIGFRMFTSREEKNAMEVKLLWTH